MITLTPGEYTVTVLAGRNLTNAQIAASTGYRVTTVGAYLKTAFRKLGVSSRAAAASVLATSTVQIAAGKPGAPAGPKLDGKSLTERLIAWAAANKGDDLTPEDAAAKFGVSAATVRARVSEAIRDGAPLECVRVIRYRHRPGTATTKDHSLR